MQATDKISLRGVRVHNLKNISADIPHGKLVVITGLSGSGKSSLAFDTLFAEGQRRYVESLSSYARQFLGRMNKPEVDFIDGIPPAIAIQQKTNNRNPRSTVGTSTEIYEYLKLLFARIGKTFSPISGVEVKRHSVTDVVNSILNLPDSTVALICFPYKFNKSQTHQNQLELILQQGYSRIVHNNEIIKTEEFLSIDKLSEKKEIHIVLDRVVVRESDNLYSRIADSVQTAFFEGNGDCCVLAIENGKHQKLNFSNKFEADGIIFELPTEHLFSFNNPIGACPLCEGFGKVLGIDQDLVIPNKSLSIYDDAVVCWKGEVMQEWKNNFIHHATKYKFPIHRPYYDLSNQEKDFLWHGKEDVSGIYSFFEYLETKKQKIQYRVMISRYRGKTTCPECKGKRLKKEAFYVKIKGKSIGDLIDISFTELRDFFKNLNLSDFEKGVAGRLIEEILVRIDSVIDVGLSYLSLNRLSGTLSGGESQRINLATVFGSGLVGSLYILDEPSIGLHSRDTQNLIRVLKNLRDRSNTVVVVEHDEEIIRAADYIIDIGPLAGNYGGEIVFAGNLTEMLKNANSLTAKYLKGEIRNPVTIKASHWKNFIEIIGARHNNLKNIDVKFPLGVITVVTGVSGSGKTSLVKGILYPAIKKQIDYVSDKTGEFTKLAGDYHLCNNIEYVDQNPIGKSSRSNPATYIKAFDEIRKLFADQKHAKANGYKPSHFSFNVSGGRCEACQGEGEITVEMQFMADVHLICEACNGKRFKEEILDIKYRDKNIYDILEMSVNEAVDFFGSAQGNTEKKIADLLQNYLNVGLGYVKLGQSSSTLSGGESQRIKLASFLSTANMKPSIFIFDEPTTGLHFHDISKLLNSFEQMKAKGHTLIIIEHNPEVIRFADWIIDLGPGGGDFGGHLVFAGTPQDMQNCKESETSRVLYNNFKTAVNL
ncbi:MAG: excinuclease ABC subunit UvrA [Bacteroidales bacterium]|nr:excinuclease ABC subunit UvrA [Bacteroidales bacterium]MDD3859451.1 excinuclease ABC subunit UvrA [Bacteroidales bacterium]